MRRFFDRLRRLFTPAVTAAGVLLFLSGCGEMPGQESAELAPTPPGFYIDSTVEDRLKLLFTTTEECAEMKGDFDSLTFVLMPPAFPCTDFPEKRCEGEFTTPNTIKFSYFWVIRHEIIHYLLYLNTGDPDANHAHPLFKSCS